MENERTWETVCQGGPAQLAGIVRGWVLVSVPELWNGQDQEQTQTVREAFGSSLEELSEAIRNEFPPQMEEDEYGKSKPIIGDVPVKKLVLRADITGGPVLLVVPISAPDDPQLAQMRNRIHELAKDKLDNEKAIAHLVPVNLYSPYPATCSIGYVAEGEQYNPNTGQGANAWG